MSYPPLTLHVENTSSRQESSIIFDVIFLMMKLPMEMDFLTVSGKQSGDYSAKSGKWSKNMYIIFRRRKQIKSVL